MRSAPVHRNVKLWNLSVGRNSIVNLMYTTFILHVQRLAYGLLCDALLLSLQHESTSDGRYGWFGN